MFVPPLAGMWLILLFDFADVARFDPGQRDQRFGFDFEVDDADFVFVFEQEGERAFGRRLRHRDLRHPADLVDHAAGAVEDELDRDVFPLQFAGNEALHRQHFLERGFVVLAEREGVVAAEGEDAEGLVADRPLDRLGPRFAEFFVGDVFEDDRVVALVAGGARGQRGRRDRGDLEAVCGHQFGGARAVGAGDEDLRRRLDPHRRPQRVVLRAGVARRLHFDFVAVGAGLLGRLHAEQEGVVADPEFDLLAADLGAVAAHGQRRFLRPPCRAPSPPARAGRRRAARPVPRPG